MTLRHEALLCHAHLVSMPLLKETYQPIFHQPNIFTSWYDKIRAIFPRYSVELIAIYSFNCSSENSVVHQDIILLLMTFLILITYLLANAWIAYGEFRCRLKMLALS